MELINHNNNSQTLQQDEKNQLKQWLLSSITNNSLQTSQSFFLESIYNSFTNNLLIDEQKVNIPLSFVKFS